jgi:hypothetical protein
LEVSFGDLQLDLPLPHQGLLNLLVSNLTSNKHLSTAVLQLGLHRLGPLRMHPPPQPANSGSTSPSTPATSVATPYGKQRTALSQQPGVHHGRKSPAWRG